VRVWLSDADGAGLARNVGGITTGVIEVADVDIVIAGVQVQTGSKTQYYIVVTRRIALKRHSAKSSIAAASRVVQKSRITKACVKAAGGIAKERADAASRIEITLRVADERVRTVRGIADAGCIANERGGSIGCVPGACRVE
jgi:hypothetical protein